MQNRFLSKTLAKISLVITMFTISACDSGQNRPSGLTAASTNEQAGFNRLALVPWTCDVGLSVPLMLDENGDVGCLANDGIHCKWSGSCQNKLQKINFETNSDPRPIKPLFCGAQHKKVWGITGYDSPSHWCAIAKKSLDLMKPTLAVDDAKEHAAACPMHQSMDAGGTCQHSGFYPPINTESYSGMGLEVNPVFEDYSCAGNINFNDKGDALVTWCEREFGSLKKANVKLKHLDHEQNQFAVLNDIYSTSSALNLEWRSGLPYASNLVLAKTTLGLFPYASFGDDGSYLVTYHEPFFSPALRNDQPLIKINAAAGSISDFQDQKITWIGTTAPDDVARNWIDGSLEIEHYERLGSKVIVYTAKGYDTLSNPSRVLYIQVYDEARKAFRLLLKKEINSPRYHVARSENGKYILVSWLDSPSLDRDPAQQCKQGCRILTASFGDSQTWQPDSVVTNVFSSVFDLKGAIDDHGNAVLAWLKENTRPADSKVDGRDLFVSSKALDQAWKEPVQLDPIDGAQLPGDSFSPNIFLGPSQNSDAHAVVSWFEISLQNLFVRQATFDFASDQPTWQFNESAPLSTSMRFQGITDDPKYNSSSLSYTESQSGDGLLVLAYQSNDSKEITGAVYASATLRGSDHQIKYRPFVRLDTAASPVRRPKIVPIGVDSSYRITWQQLDSKKSQWSHWFAAYKAGGHTHRDIENFAAEVTESGETAGGRPDLLTLSWEWQQEQAANVSFTYDVVRGGDNSVTNYGAKTLAIKTAQPNHYTAQIDVSNWSGGDYQIAIYATYEANGMKAKSLKSTPVGFKLQSKPTSSEPTPPTGLTPPTPESIPVLSQLVGTATDANNKTLKLTWRETNLEGYTRISCYHELQNGVRGLIATTNADDRTLSQNEIQASSGADAYQAALDYGALPVGEYRVTMKCTYSHPDFKNTFESNVAQSDWFTVVEYVVPASYLQMDGDSAACQATNSIATEPMMVDLVNGKIILHGGTDNRIDLGSRYELSTRTTTLDEYLRPAVFHDDTMYPWWPTAMATGSWQQQSVFSYDVTEKANSITYSERRWSGHNNYIVLVRFCANVTTKSGVITYQSDLHVAKPNSNLEPVAPQLLMQANGGIKYWAD